MASVKATSTLGVVSKLSLRLQQAALSSSRAPMRSVFMVGSKLISVLKRCWVISTSLSWAICGNTMRMRCSWVGTAALSIRSCPARIQMRCTVSGICKLKLPSALVSTWCFLSLKTRAPTMGVIILPGRRSATVPSMVLYVCCAKTGKTSSSRKPAKKRT